MEKSKTFMRHIKLISMNRRLFWVNQVCFLDEFFLDESYDPSCLASRHTMKLGKQAASPVVVHL
jgi:hypothetical protein